MKTRVDVLHVDSVVGRIEDEKDRQQLQIGWQIVRVKPISQRVTITFGAWVEESGRPALRHCGGHGVWMA